MTFDWAIVNYLIQWLIIPLVGLIWNLVQKVDRLEKDSLRTITIVQEQEKYRIAQREGQDHNIEGLRKSLELVQLRLDDISKILARLQGQQDKN
jgi:hypothetical protein